MCIYALTGFIISTEVSVYMEFGKTEVVANIYTYNPHIIGDAIKIMKYLQVFCHEDGYKQSKVWLYFLSSSQFFESHDFYPLDHISCHVPTPTTTTTTTTITRSIYWLSSCFCFLHFEDGD
jgi:hypothetical protein